MTNDNNDFPESDPTPPTGSKDDPEELRLPGGITAEMQADGGAFVPESELESSSTGEGAERTRRQVRMQKRSFHAGPLPAPEQLAAYDDVLPGLHERIVEMTEVQLEHQQDLENRDLDHRHEMQFRDQKADRWLTTVGQFCAFSIAMGALAIVGLMVVYGFPASAVVALVFVIGLLCVAFVVGRRYRSEEIAKAYLRPAGREANESGETEGSNEANRNSG